MAEAPGPVSRRYMGYALGICFCANFLNYLDRFIISALLPEIKKDLQMGDDLAGALITAFTLGYMLAAPIVGVLSDRYSRPRLFAACILIWSGATLLTGLTRSPGEMLFVRVFIGVGEAGCLAIGPSLISDVFPPRQRGRAMSLFFLGLPLGSAAGYLAGGQFEGPMAWRDAFIYAGAAGLPLAILLFFLRDAPRGLHETEGDEGLRIVGFRPYLGLLKIRTLLLIILAQAFAAFAIVPIVHFGVDFFQTIRKWDKEDVTLMVAIATFAGVGGNLLSGFIGDKLQRRLPGIYALIAAIGFLGGLPFMVLALNAGSVAAATPMLSLTMFCYFACMPAVNAQIASVTLPTQRSMAFALTVFILHLLGDTISPPLFGIISKATSQETAFTYLPYILVASGVLSFMASRSAPRDAVRMHEETRSLPLVTP